MRSAPGPEKERAVMVRALMGPMTLRKAAKVEKRKVGATAVVDQASGSYVKMSGSDCGEVLVKEEVSVSGSGEPKLKPSVFER